MTQETEHRIFEVVDKVLAELSKALGHTEYRYEQVVCGGQELIREYGNQTLSAVLFDLTAKAFPGGKTDDSLKPENLDAYMAAVDTRQKSEALLLSLPEPNTQDLELTLGVVVALLPKLRQILLPFAKKLPHPPGGRPKKLSDPSKRRAVRDEIGRLLAGGVDLLDAQKRLAHREQVGLSTIQRIWRERKKLNIDNDSALIK